MRTSLRFVWIVVGMMVALQGCRTLPYQNKPLAHYDPSAGYRYANLAPGENNSNSLTVLMTFSGGGTRAASFAYGVLEKLRDTNIVWEGQPRRFLDEIDIISSVSGGSLPCAYYGLYGDKIFEDFPDKVLYRNIQGGMVKQVFKPGNWPKLFSSFYGRTDMLADDFSHNIFEDKTFGDLLARNRRPFLVINSTNVTSGYRFDFTQRQFDFLYSDLSSFPLGRAVAASAAFPGLLTPLTVRNYPKKDDYIRPAWVDEELKIPDANRMRHKQAREAESYITSNRPFVHLTDGGVADNLGILPLIQLLGDEYPGDVSSSIIAHPDIKKVVIIVVNAERTSPISADAQVEALGLLKVLGVVTSTPAGNFSASELALLRLFARQATDKQQMREKIRRLYGEDVLKQQFPELIAPDIDYHLVEVDYSQMPEAADRDYLNALPTSFKLERDQVDRLRAAAGTILDHNSEYQSVIQELK